MAKLNVKSIRRDQPWGGRERLRRSRLPVAVGNGFDQTFEPNYARIPTRTVRGKQGLVSVPRVAGQSAVWSILEAYIEVTLIPGLATPS